MGELKKIDKKQRALEYSRKWKSENRERTRYLNKKSRANNPLTSMLNKAMTRSKKKNIEYSLDKEWLISIIDQGVCQVTGLRFKMLFGKKDPFMPSIDRIDSSKGYTKDNCQVVIWLYNRAKGADTDFDVLTMAKAIVELNESKRSYEE